MTASDYRRRALELLDDYLAGKATRESVWQWAQEVIISKEWGKLPSDLQDAIHGLWLLHDNEGSWVPNAAEIRRIHDDLARQA
jgi:hypothetical protein